MLDASEPLCVSERNAEIRSLLIEYGDQVGRLARKWGENVSYF